MSLQIYKKACRCYFQTTSKIALIWKRSCGTRAFRPNCFSFPLRILDEQLYMSGQPYTCTRIRKSSSSSSEIVPVREKMEILIRKPVPKIKRKPFAKDLFLGKFDKDVLAFPEILEPEDITNIKNLSDGAREVLNSRQKSSETEGDEELISPVILQRFKELGYFGLEVPVEYDGSAMTATEVMHMAEAWGTDLNMALMLDVHHSVAVHGVLKSGSEQLKKTYLSDLATGQRIAAFCLTEPSSGSDISMIQTNLTSVDDQEGKYLLNGTKTWVTNGGLADVYLVFANVLLQTSRGETEPHFSAVMVDRKKHGLQVEPIGETLGVRGLNISTVHFKDTPISAEDIVGKFGDGLKIATEIMTSNRLALGGNVTGLLKEIIKTVREHCIRRKSFDKELMDHQIIKMKISKMICTAYAIESMTYLTAGLFDSTEDPDLQLEAAMVKIYSSQGLWECINEAVQLLGADGYKQGNLERWLRDSRALPFVCGTNEILKQFIGLIGCDHAGGQIAENVRKMRNSLFHPVFAWKKMNQLVRYDNFKMKLDLDLSGYLHLSLKKPSDWMESCVKKFAFMTDLVMTRYGAHTDVAQIDLERLADIAMEIYCMAAVLSRASRSYCIGLRNETHEINVATTICYNCQQKIEEYLDELRKGPFDNCDASRIQIANVTFRDGGFSLESPITRNW